MKKVNISYVAIWYGGDLLITAALIIAGFVSNIIWLSAIAFMLFIVSLILIPGILEKKMAKNALELEKSFPQKGFSYQYKFTSNSGVFYIDTNGRLGVVWKNNPTQLYFADLSKVTDIRTDDGKQLRGTALVSCKFKLDGKKFKIYTLRVSNGQLAMNSPKVIEAISKADKMCEMLKLAKQNALNGAAIQS